MSNKQERRAAFEKVFGGVNVSFSRSNEAMRSNGRTEIRQGKTARDKANGHVPYQKNKREWDSTQRRFVKA